MANTGDIRNIVIMGHGGAGKTSLVEAILHKTGATNRLGSVDDKTSICDYYDEEKAHGHSIKSSVVHTQYGGKQINIIDTPGFPDFIGPSIKAIAGAETAVIVINAAVGHRDHYPQGIRDGDKDRQGQADSHQQNGRRKRRSCRD